MRNLRMRAVAATLLFLLAIVLPTNTFAQQATARIVGTITDPAGAVVPGVKVTVISVATQEKSETITDKDGAYQVLNLPIGTYRVVAEKAGFRTVTTTTPSLQINQALHIDVHLLVGGREETVTVEGAASAVETVNPTLGASITSRPIIDMPLNGRNVLSLAMLQPGVTETNTTSNGTSNGQAGGFSISGGKSDSVTFLLDGGMNNNLLSNGVVYNPNPDTVAEFRILKSDYTAEYGRNAGGIISVVTKSGGNTIHGSAYDYLRNDYFNANSYFNKETGTPREVLKRNQFGATIGGPIVKDKLFWFFGYQGQRQTAQRTSESNFTVFTPAELTGDFSHSGPGGTVDPNVAAYLLANPYYQANAALAARGIMDPTKIDAVAKKYIAAGLIPSSATGKLTTQSGAIDNNNDFTAKVDYNVTQKDRVSVTLGMLKYPNTTPFSGGSYIPGQGITGRSDRYFSNISYTRAFSPRLINEFHFTAQRQNQFQAVPQTKQPTAADLGIKTTPDDPTGPPILGFDRGLTSGFSPQGPTHLVDNSFLFSNTVSWVKGKHTLKFGGLYSPYYNNTVYDFYVNGEFFFYGASGSSFSGNDFADFMMGNPDEYLQFGKAPSNIRTHSYGVFAQDEWRIGRNLVLTYGLRYEYNSPKTDTQGRSFSIIPGQQSTRFPNAPLGLVFPGDKGAPQGANFPDRNDFAPRFGFAWDPKGNGKMSIRGGIGVFYDVLKGEDNLQFNGQAPFFGFSDLFPGPLANGTSNGLADPYGSTGSPNPFPSKTPAQNINFDLSGFLPFGGGGVYFVNPHMRTPYTYQYNLNLQRQLPWGMVLETGYVGSNTHKQTALYDSNPFNPGAPKRVLNLQPGIQTFTTTSRAFSYLDTFGNVVNAHFNSWQTSLTKQISDSRWLGHTYFTLGYTWGQSIDNASGFRNTGSRVPVSNTNMFQAVSDYDITHRFTFSGGWDLPINELVGASNRLTKGWSVYPIFTHRSGFPLNVSAGLNRSSSSAGPSGYGDQTLIHPMLIGPLTTFDPHQIQTINSLTGNFWFNIASLTNTGLTGYGTLPRNAFRGPGRTNLDFALAKDTPITERISTEFRAEAFNIFNHAEWNNPVTSFTSAQFGQIVTTADPRILQFAIRIKF